MQCSKAFQLLALSYLFDLFSGSMLPNPVFTGVLHKIVQKKVIKYFDDIEKPIHLFLVTKQNKYSL